MLYTSIGGTPEEVATEMKDLDKTKEQLIDELVEVQPGVLVLQLNGKRDSRSMQHLMELLLERIVERNSSVALFDLTDMLTVDTRTAQHLTDTISAAQRLDTQVILIGLHPSISRLLAHLGVDLSGIATCSSLVAGLWTALDIVESQVANKTSRGEITKDEGKTRKQLIVETEYGRGSEFTFKLPVEYQRIKHKRARGGE